MDDRFREIMNFLRTVIEEENLQVTVKNSLKNGLAAGIGGFFGSLIGGPLGAVPGAAIGAGIAASTGENFKPLWQVIAEWSPEQKQRLQGHVENIMQRVKARDVAAFAAMAAGAAPALRAEIVAAVIDFCTNEMALEVGRR